MLLMSIQPSAPGTTSNSPGAGNAPPVRRSLTEQVMDFVRTATASGDLRPGELYSVYQLAERLGFSRSPVRDGLLRLEEAGLVEFARNRGFRIIPTTPQDVAEIFSIRLALEVPAARRAAMACSDELATALKALEASMARAARAGDDESFFADDQYLHDLLLEAAGSHRAREVVNRLRVSTRLLGVSTAGRQRTYEDILTEHAPIVAAVIANDPQCAGQLMSEHLATTGRLLLAQAAARQDLDIDAARLWDELTRGY